MSLLTSILLNDAVNKGGPGSGPQGGPKIQSLNAKQSAKKTERILRQRESKINRLQEKYTMMSRKEAEAHVDAKNPHYEAYKGLRYNGA